MEGLLILLVVVWLIGLPFVAICNACRLTAIERQLAEFTVLLHLLSVKGEAKKKESPGEKEKGKGIGAKEKIEEKGEEEKGGTEDGRTAVPLVEPPVEPQPIAIRHAPGTPWTKPDEPARPKEPECRTSGWDRAVEAFWIKVEDWFTVRGEFAPKGMTREFAVATRWLVRVGIVMILASLVYFVKLSIARGWMGPQARVVCMVLWGGAGVAGGTWLVKKTKYALIGHALAALGVISLYFGFGFGHRLFDPPVIASAGLAFAALAGVTALAGVLSVVLPSSTLAVMGLVGGYLVPVIAGRDTGNPLGLCFYLTLLNLGAYAVAHLRRWPGLDLLATGFAYLMISIWCGRHAAIGTGAMTTLLVFVSIIHLLYMATIVIGGRCGDGAEQKRVIRRVYGWVGLCLNALVYLGWVCLPFRSVCGGLTTGFVLLGVAAVYIASAVVANRCGRLDRIGVDLLLAFALVDLALAPVLLLDGSWLAVSWSLLAVAMAEVAHRTENGVLKVMACLVLICAGFAGLTHDAHAFFLPATTGAAWCRAFALRLVRLWTFPAALAFVGLRTGPRELLYVTGALTFLSFTGEAHLFGATFLPMAKGGVVTLAWASVAFGSLWLGLVKRMKPLRLAGLGLLAVSVGKLLLIDTAGLVMPVRVAVFAAVGILLIVGATLYLKFKERFEK